MLWDFYGGSILWETFFGTQYMASIGVNKSQESQFSGLEELAFLLADGKGNLL